MSEEATPFVTVNLKKLLPGAKKGSSHSGGSSGGSKAAMGDLPVTEREFIAQCQREYEAAAAHGGQQSLDACFRLSWALVHSLERADQQRGVELAEALADHPPAGGGGEGAGDAPGLEARDLQYLIAVGKYRQRKYIEARRVLKAVLQDNPEFRQGESLLELCDKEIVKDGLVGVGAGAALAAVAAIAISALARR